VPGSREDLLVFWEVPARDSAFLLNGGLGFVVLIFPTAKEANALLDNFQGIVWLLLEDLFDVNLFLDTLTDLVRDGLQDVLEFIVILANVAGNGPDELKAVEQTCKRVLDSLEVSMCDVLKLAFEGSQELHEVLGFGVLLVEICASDTEVLEGLVFLPRVFGIQNLKALRNLNLQFQCA